MLRHSYTHASAQELLADPSTLAVVALDEACCSDDVIHTGLLPLGKGTPYSVWQIPGSTVTRGKSGVCQWSRSDELLCVSVALSAEQCQDISLSTEHAYLALLQCSLEEGYRYPLRFWNYLPAINEGAGDQELYKQFCLGRFQAFEQMHVPAEGYPAASALGHHQQGAIIFGFMAKTSGQHIENPVQQSAYHYPRQYGPNGPSFARATQGHIVGEAPTLFISGTASIVGYESIAVGDIKVQLKTTLENIEKVRQQASAQAKVDSLMVYLRHPQDYDYTAGQLDQYFPDAKKIYTHADICRAELLIEIEALCHG